jgi:hypothetical protein
MFTWICPQCGREVPPSYNDCPDCAKKGGEPASPAPADALPALPALPAVLATSSPRPAPVPPAAPPMPEAVPRMEAPPSLPYQPPAARASLPTWLLTVVFVFAFFGIGAGIYWVVGYMRGSSKPVVTVESPAAKPGTSTNPYQKYIEVSGVRFTEDAKKKLEVKFVLTNHSGADILGLAGNVTIWGRTQKSEEEAAGTFSFNTELKPFESKELTSPLATKLKAIELPDWQNISTDLQVTAPGASGGSPAPR